MQLAGKREGAGSTQNGSPERVVTVLAVSPHAEDHILLRNIFSHSNWQIQSAHNWYEGRNQLHAKPASVIICEHNLPDATWKDVLGYLQGAHDAPVLIVAARTADDHLWAEVLNLGAYDLLLKPFEQSEVVRVVSLAWLNWKHERERARKQPAAAAAPLPRLMVAGA